MEEEEEGEEEIEEGEGEEERRRNGLWVAVMNRKKTHPPSSWVHGENINAEEVFLERLGLVSKRFKS